MNNQQPNTEPQIILQSDAATAYPELDDMQLEIVAGGKDGDLCTVYPEAIGAARCQ